MENKVSPIVKAPFEVTDISSANWTIRKILEHQAAIDEVKAQADKMKTEIEEWLQSETEEHQKSVDSLSALLSPFVVSQIEGTKKRSIKLPSGTAGFRKGSVTFTLEGEKVDKKSEQLLKFVKYHKLDEYIITEEYVDWASLKKSLNVTDDGKVISADGEVFDVMAATQEPDKFYVQAVK